MKKISTIPFLLVVSLFSFSAFAEKITLTCRYNTGSELMPFSIDIETKKVIWGDVDAGWRLVGKVDRYITMKPPESENSIGGMYVVVDRVSGDFVLTNVSVNTLLNRMEGQTGKGTCHTKIF
jgi:hypothetical protein